MCLLAFFTEQVSTLATADCCSTMCSQLRGEMNEEQLSREQILKPEGIVKNRLFILLKAIVVGGSGRSIGFAYSISQGIRDRIAEDGAVKNKRMEFAILAGRVYVGW